MVAVSVVLSSRPKSAEIRYARWMDIERAQCPVCGYSIRLEHGLLVRHVSPPTTDLDRERDCSGSLSAPVALGARAQGQS